MVSQLLAVSDMLAFIYDEQPSEEDFIKEMASMSLTANLSWDRICNAVMQRP